MPADVIVPVLRERHFDFSYLATSTTETVRLIGAYPVHDFSSAILVVRLQHNAIVTGSVSVYAYSTAPSPYDPREFRRGEEDLSASFSNSDSAPAMLEGTTGFINGPCYAVEFVVAQGSNKALAFQMSVDLLLRKSRLG